MTSGSSVWGPRPTSNLMSPGSGRTDPLLWWFLCIVGSLLVFVRASCGGSCRQIIVCEYDSVGIKTYQKG